MKNYRVEQFCNKNQFVITGKGETIFQSYSSTIAIIKNGNLTLFSDWDYSHTTLKHLYLFLDEYKYQLTQNIKNIIIDVLSSSNKKQKIQKYIDSKLIKYKED